MPSPSSPMLITPTVAIHSAIATINTASPTVAFGLALRIKSNR